MEEEGSSVTALVLSLSLTCLLSNYVHHSFDLSFLKCETVHGSQPALRSIQRHEQIPVLAITAITAAAQAGKALGSTSSLHPSPPLQVFSEQLPSPRSRRPAVAQPAHAGLIFPTCIYHLMQGIASTYLSALGHCALPVGEGGPC